MSRTIAYILLFLSTAVLQLCLFDNLWVSVCLDPLVYVIFIALLPLDLPAVALLGLGGGVGVAMDFMMGAAGLNTIATLLVAFVRPGLLRVLYRREDLRDGGIPSPERLGRGVFLDYLVILILLHHTVFSALESLSWVHALRTALRIVTSSAVTVFFTWAFARIFTSKLLARS